MWERSRGGEGGKRGVGGVGGEVWGCGRKMGMGRGGGVEKWCEGGREGGKRGREEGHLVSMSSGTHIGRLYNTETESQGKRVQGEVNAKRFTVLRCGTVNRFGV